MILKLIAMIMLIITLALPLVAIFLSKTSACDIYNSVTKHGTFGIIVCAVVYITATFLISWVLAFYLDSKECAEKGVGKW